MPSLLKKIETEYRKHVHDAPVLIRIHLKLSLVDAAKVDWGTAKESARDEAAIAATGAAVRGRSVLGLVCFRGLLRWFRAFGLHPA